MECRESHVVFPIINPLLLWTFWFLLSSSKSQVKIRFRFSDRTQVETQFPTTSNLSALYSFLPTTLTSEHSKSKFTLYQTPPRKDLQPNDPKLKEKNLGELGMTPQAVIYVRWKDENLNQTTSRPPLKEELWKEAEECEPPKGLDERNNTESLGNGRTLGETHGETKTEGDNEGKDRSSKVSRFSLFALVLSLFPSFFTDLFLYSLCQSPGRAQMVDERIQKVKDLTLRSNAIRYLPLSSKSLSVSSQSM